MANIKQAHPFRHIAQPLSMAIKSRPFLRNFASKLRKRKENLSLSNQYQSMSASILWRKDSIAIKSHYLSSANKKEHTTNRPKSDSRVKESIPHCTSIGRSSLCLLFPLESKAFRCFRSTTKATSQSTSIIGFRSWIPKVISTFPKEIN
jgi:hypothetical protein